MKRKSIWFLLGMLIASLTFALAACGGGKKESKYSLSETAITLQVGGTKQLNVTPAPEGEVAWETDNEAVATVEGGLVTAVAQGEAKITATVEGEETPLTCTVTVEAKPAGGGYTLDVTSVALKTGETKQLTVKDKNGAPATGATFTSETPAVATVSQTGLITAVAVGKTNVKAKIGGDTLTCAVTVEQGYTYSLNKTSLDIAVGGSDTIELITTPSAPANARPHTFTSTNPAIATVDGGSGKVTGVAKGETTITCSVDGEELEATVKVTNYTVKLDGAALPETINLRVGDEAKTVTVEADPARTDLASIVTYASQQPTVATFENGTLTAVSGGTTQISVAVGGKTFTANVVVGAEVQYTLKADGEDIEDDTLSMKLGDTVTLTVERDPEGALPAITYDSDDDTIAEVTEAGVITAKKPGTTNITVKVEGADTFEITVNVTYDVVQTEVDYPSDSERTAVTLDALDETNVTLDWRYFGQRNYTERKNGGNLIGEIDKYAQKSDDFYDYRVDMSWTDGTTTAQSLNGRKDGITFKTNISFDVKFTKDAKYISIFTGAWHATNTISISYEGVVCASKTFTNDGGNGNKNKQIIFTPDQENFIGTEMTFTVTIEFRGDGNSANNVSLVAIAVVGNDAREDEGPSATAVAPEVKALTEETRNLSVIGTEDWVYSKNGSGTLVRRSGVSNIIKESDIHYTDGPSGANLDTGFGRFTWYEQDSSAAPEGGSVNNFQFDNGTYSIPVHLTVGKHVVTLFLSGWKVSYSVAVLDSNANSILAASKVVTGNGSTNQAVEVKITIDVTKEDTFTFSMSKEGDGNHGWAAIAVGYATDLTLEKTEFDLTKDVETTEKVVVKKGDETQTASFDSSDSQVVTVNQADGTLTAVGAGRAIITATIGGVELRAFVTVTEYTLTSGEEITISVEKTAEIRITANPSRTFTATYKVTAGDEYIEVSPDGVITANAKGQGTVTATVDGKVFTINVTVVEYKLDQTEITLTLGGEPATATLKMTEGDAGTDVSDVAFSTDDNKIADIDATSGVITAKGFGQTTVHAEKDGTTLDCTVIVKLKVTPTEKDYPEGSDETVNLDELDETNVTLDWHFFRDDTVHKMAGGNLIGNLDKARSSGFGDYRTHITWYNGDDTEKASVFGYTDGITFNGGGDNSTFSFPVTVTQDVTKIVILTGAWHAKNTITISYNGVEYAKFEFVNENDNGSADKNKQVIFTPDMTNFGTEEKTFTITMSCSDNSSGNKENISLVAIAVIGKTPRGAHTQATASQTHELTSNGEAVDLTTVGTLDWAYICDHTNGLVTKKIESHVIGRVNCIGTQGDGHDNFANQSFKWSDGTETPLGGETTDRFKWCDNVQAICVTLQQSAKVTLWISAWQGSIDLTVYDRCTEILAKTRVIDGDGSASKGVKVEVTLTVTEESTFTFLMKKDGGGNFGLGAIAVANAATD